MSKAKSTLIASLIGSAVGIGGWLVGLGNSIWPQHPQWALFFLTIAITIISMFVAEREHRRRFGRS
jgi:ABC-type branched-subunit amino acid transport system permease subunit